MTDGATLDQATSATPSPRKATTSSRRSPGGTTSQTKVPCTKTPYVGVAVVASGHDEPNKVPCTKTTKPTKVVACAK